MKATTVHLPAGYTSASAADLRELAPRIQVRMIGTLMATSEF